MEDIINKLIGLDDSAKNKIKVIKEKEENIENYIEEKLKIKKIQDEYEKNNDNILQKLLNFIG